MSDQNEKNLNQPEEGQDDFSSMSIDELIASTKEEIARIDQMMGTSRLPQQEDAQEPAPQEGAPQAPQSIPGSELRTRPISSIFLRETSRSSSSRRTGR